ncbi:Cyt-b5 [Symbiodinium sp. KB8]|nr:Cyt-b5 [Symbiodinium sp. KB8]
MLQALVHRLWLMRLEVLDAPTWELFLVSNRVRSQAATLDEELDKYFAKDKPKEPPEPKVELSPEEKQDRMVAAMLLRSARSKAEQAEASGMTAYLEEEAQLNKSVNKRLLAGEVSQARSFNRRTGIEPLPAAESDSAPLSVEEREAKALEQEYVRSAHQMREQPPPLLPKESVAPARKKQRVGTQGKLLDLAAMEEEAARQADEDAESANPLLRPPPKLVKRKAPKAADEDPRGLAPKRESLEEQEQSLWPSKGMRVRVLSETGELKMHHLQTGVVRRRHAARGAVDVALDDSDRMLKMVPQTKLQTFVSKTCNRIEVVRGGHRGVIAELVSQDASQKLATIRLGRGQAQQELVVSLHDVCEFI